MARVKLNQELKLDNGTITTCAALLDSGKAFVRRIERFGKAERTIYIVDLNDGNGGYFEISRYAYQSRAARGQDKRPAPIAVAQVAALPPGEWTGECFEVDTDYDGMIAIRKTCYEIHAESNNPAGTSWHVWYSLNQDE